MRTLILRERRMSPANTVSPATLLMLPRLQLSLAAFVVGLTIVSTIRLTIFAAQSSIPGLRKAVGTCKSRLSKCSPRSKERKREPLVPWCQISSLSNVGSRR